MTVKADVDGNASVVIELDHLELARALLRDHPVMVDKIADATGLPSEQTPQMLAEVLRFLSLIVHANKVLTPPRILDLAWHEFILFTRVYDAWCRQFLGRFVHHTPGGTADENLFQLKRTLKLYNLFFGPPDPRFWGEHGYFSEAAQCGACEGT